MIKNIPSDAIDFPGQIKYSLIGERDCTNFASILIENDVTAFNKKVCVDLLKKCVSKSIVRAAYINQGLNQFPVDSRAHEIQSYHSQHYIERFTELVAIGLDKFPSLGNDQEFLQDYATVMDVMNGKGYFSNIVDGEDFAIFKEQLSNPKNRINLIPRTVKNFIFVQKK